MVWFALPVVDSQYSEMLPAFRVVSLGMDFMTSMITSLALLSVDPKRSGMISAAVNLFRQISGAFMASGARGSGSRTHPPLNDLRKERSSAPPGAAETKRCREPSFELSFRDQEIGGCGVSKGASFPCHSAVCYGLCRKRSRHKIPITVAHGCAW